VPPDWLLPLLGVAIGLAGATWSHLRPDRYPIQGGPVEQDDVDPVRLRQIDARNQTQLQVTREAAAPPESRNSVAHVECELAGHDWMTADIGFDRCSRCGRNRALVSRPAVDRVFNYGGPTGRAGLPQSGGPGDAVAVEGRDRPVDRVVYPRAQCADSGHLMILGNPVCMRCGEDVTR
jgi:hypothetical protein